MPVAAMAQSGSMLFQRIMQEARRGRSTHPCRCANADHRMLLNRFYAIEDGHGWGGAAHALIIRTVIAGENQGRLYDISG